MDLFSTSRRVKLQGVQFYRTAASIIEVSSFFNLGLTAVSVLSGICCAVWWWGNADHQTWGARVNIWRKPRGLSGRYRRTAGQCWTALYFTFLPFKNTLLLPLFYLRTFISNNIWYTITLAVPYKDISWKCSFWNLVLFSSAGDGGREAGWECWEDGSVAACRAEQAAKRHRDHSERERPPERRRHQRDQRYNIVWNSLVCRHYWLWKVRSAKKTAAWSGSTFIVARGQVSEAEEFLHHHMILSTFLRIYKWSKIPQN